MSPTPARSTSAAQSCEDGTSTPLHVEQPSAELTAALSKAANLEVALHTSRHTGIAIGILMARQRLTEDQAFEALRAASQHRQVKLRDVAAEVVLTGSLVG